MNTYKAIKECRKKHGLTQAALAEKLCIVPSAYSKIERGKTRVTVEVLLALSKIFSVPPSYLLGETSVKEDELINKITQLKSTLNKKKSLVDKLNNNLKAYKNEVESMLFLEYLNVTSDLWEPEPEEDVKKWMNLLDINYDTMEGWPFYIPDDKEYEAIRSIFIKNRHFSVCFMQGLLDSDNYFYPFWERFVKEHDIRYEFTNDGNTLNATNLPSDLPF